MMNNASTTLEPLFNFLEYTVTTAQVIFDKLPGSAVIQRYVKISHQNDPGRTLLEIILIVFAIRTTTISYTSRKEWQTFHKVQPKRMSLNRSNQPNFVLKFLFFSFSHQQIHELVDEWIPEPLAQPLSIIDNRTI